VGCRFRVVRDQSGIEPLQFGTEFGVTGTHLSCGFHLKSDLRVR